MSTRGAPAPAPTAAQTRAAARLLRRARHALGPARWRRMVHLAALSIAQRQAQQPQPQPQPQPPPRGRAHPWRAAAPTFDARRAAAGDLHED